LARWVEGDDSAPKAREQRLSKKASWRPRADDPCVGKVPAFKVTLRILKPVACQFAGRSHAA
jgi:hypothetical protein